MTVIIRNEIILLFRDGRMVIAAVAVLLGMAAAGISGWSQYQRSEQERAHFTEEARNQWLGQGERHPHRAAHFGTYVTKPELSLAFFEPGLRPFAGQTLWLEAHDRPAFANIPSEDDATLNTGVGMASGSAILQIMGGLLALTMSALAFARERETGILRQILAQGTSARALVWGKFLALCLAIGGPLCAGALLLAAGAAALAAPGDRVDIVLRALMLIGGDALLIGALIAVGLAVSAVARSSRMAVLVAFAIWVGGFVIAPRLAATLIEQVSAAPGLAAYQQAVTRDFNEGIDARGGYTAQLRALEQSTMRRHGVTRLGDLPVGFSGLRMRHMDQWRTEMDDIQYRRLTDTYDRQLLIRVAMSTTAPFIAARSFSQGMAGMDWFHYRDFLEAAERYRREFGFRMNRVLEKGVLGDHWEMDGDISDWSSVPPFQYQTPRFGWAVARQAPFLAVLLAWVGAGAAMLALAGRRLRP
jgi:ABC-2 type transport system permease protein